MKPKSLLGTLLLLAAGTLSGTALDWTQGNGFRSAPLTPPAAGAAGFSLLPSPQTGITFTNHLTDRSIAYNRIYENGSGVALGDVDGDGLCDIYFCRLEGDNLLYRNLGNWRFEDITASAGVACPNQYSTAAVLADLDGDGDLDLLVNSIGGGTREFLNDGKGHFAELTGTRLVRRFGSTSMALADIDGDGDLDLYVTNYRTDTYKDRPPGLKVEASMVGGKIVVTPEDRFIPITPRQGGVEVLELGERDFLYLNDGKGHFAPVSWTAGAFLDEDGKALTAPPKDWGLSVIFRDMDGDGTPDIYVCNDFFYSPDRAWLNKSGFHAIPRTALRNMSLASMAVDFADINRDGFDDFVVVDMLSRSSASRHRQRPNMMRGLVDPPVLDPLYRPEVARNTLFLNRGDGTYAEIAQLSGLEATEWSWSAVFLDVDLDGYEDLLIGNGNSHDVQDADALRAIATIRTNESPEQRLRRFPRLETENLAFRNQHDLTFRDASTEWGFNLRGVSHGMALADLDNDGDLDVVVNNLNAPAAIYRNETTAARIGVRLNGRAPNTHGIGAKVKVLRGPVTQSQEIMSGGRYLSSDDPMRVFAAGTNKMRLEVRWRSGLRSMVEGAEPNRIYEIDETYARSTSERPPPPISPLFQEVTSLLGGHSHQDQPFDDYARQPTLGRKFSSPGPGVSWIDLDSDGFAELVIGAGTGSAMTIFKHDGKGGFTNWNTTFPIQDRDQTAILPWRSAGTNLTLLAGISNYEDADTNAPAALFLNPLFGESKPALPGLPASVGSLTAADVDGDGQLELFVAGRIIPSRYPEPASSHLYKYIDGAFQADPVNDATFRQAGIVAGATFSDLDNDGFPELILACEWGPIRIFWNEKGKLVPREMGLKGFTGWWTAVATGDLDGDGLMDIVACNWGRNTKYQTTLAQGASVLFGDYDENGAMELVETYRDQVSQKRVPWRDFESLTASLPVISQQVSTFKGYGEASVEALLGDWIQKSTTLTVTNLDSMVFFNRRTHFEAKALPIEAQIAPCFGVSVNDFDGDGAEDIFLGQNFFEVEPETARSDAGVGILLRGDGEGGFTAIKPQYSGIRVYGQARGVAAADFDEDGRLDLCVGQNRSKTLLFRNLSANPGWKVRLLGPQGNPAAVGATIRLKADGKLGAAKQIKAGTGYLSQESLTQVMTAPGPSPLGIQDSAWRTDRTKGVAKPENKVSLAPTEVWVKWPGGRETTALVREKAGGRTIELFFPSR